MNLLSGKCFLAIKPFLRFKATFACLFGLIATTMLVAQNQNDTIILQLKWKNQFQFAGYYAAVEKGFYEQAGLKVKLLPNPVGMDVIEEVLEGNAQYGIEATNLMLARDKGHPVVILASIFQHSAEAIISIREKNVFSPHDMIGKVGGVIGDGTGSTLAMLKNEGVSIEDFTPVKNTSIHELQYGNIDFLEIYITDAPYLLQKDGFTPVVIRPISYGVDFYGDCLFTTSDEIAKHPQRVEAFVEASLQGWIYAMKHKEEIIDLILNKYQPTLTRDVLDYEADAMQSLIMPDVVEIGYSNPGRWEHIADVYKQLGMISSGFSVDDLLYQPVPDKYRYRLLIYIIAFILAVSIIVVFIFYYFNKRLKASVIERTEELARKNRELMDEMSRRQKLMVEMQLSEQRFKGLFEDSPISIWEIDLSAVRTAYEQKIAEGVTDFENYIQEHQDFLENCINSQHIVNVNKTTLKYFNVVDIEELRDSILKLFTPSAIQMVGRKFLSLANGKLFFEAELEMRTFDGKPIWISANVYLPFGYESDWKRLIVALIDISIQKKANQRLLEKEVLLQKQNTEYLKLNNELLARNEKVRDINRQLEKAILKAEESDRLKTAFLSNMSHEIRTPMNGIVGFADLLKQQDLTKAEREEYIEVINNSSQQLLRIISDIIDISKIESDQLSVEYGSVNLPVLFHELEMLYQIKCLREHNSHISMRFEVEEGVELMRTDEVRLKQVLSNLLDNALKFTHEGEILCRVQNEPGGFMRFMVKDTGVGIPGEMQALVFQRFFQVDSVKNQQMGGTGLGLSISKKLVELLNGRMWVESKTNLGSTFFFKLPVDENPV